MKDENSTKRVSQAEREGEVGKGFFPIKNKVFLYFKKEI